MWHSSALSLYCAFYMYGQSQRCAYKETVPTLCILNAGTAPTFSPSKLGHRNDLIICFFDVVHLNGSESSWLVGRSIPSREFNPLEGLPSPRRRQRQILHVYRTQFVSTNERRAAFALTNPIEVLGRWRNVDLWQRPTTSGPLQKPFGKGSKK